uniref:Uncharacterized protein n=1 Tax=Vespula pensylvanica TaxID=30213 RepID=A0A834PB22_VESPE|nr:hypothetical protein H0235_002997 [Vespula pensylvanica]
MAWRVSRVRYSTGKAQTSNAYEFVRLVPNIVGQRTARTLDCICTETAVKQHQHPFLFVPFCLISLKVSSANNVRLCFPDKLFVSTLEAYM